MTARRPSDYERFLYYVFTIKHWEWRYRFGVNRAPDWTPGKYRDQRHVQVHGKLVQPLSLARYSVSLTLVPRDRRQIDDELEREQGRVGTLCLNRPMKSLEAAVSVPHDALENILSMLHAKYFQFVTLDSEKFSRGRAPILQYTFSAELDPDELQEVAADSSANGSG